MILVILAVFIVVFICGAFMMNSYSIDEYISEPVALVGMLGSMISIVIMIILIIGVSNGRAIDKRIAMYEEENAKIEAQIAAVVENYMDYEGDTFKSIAKNNEDAMLLVSLYPDLKSDTLVSTQISVYQENNKKIRELKDDKIMLSIKQWWLYFGGKDK